MEAMRTVDFHGASRLTRTELAFKVGLLKLELNQMAHRNCRLADCRKTILYPLMCAFVAVRLDYFFR